MDFGELTISQILLSAFSGFGLLLLSWVFGRKVFRKFKANERQNSVVQQENEVQGDIAGGNIIKSSDFEEIEVNQGKAKVIQSKNTVGGDMAGGNIVVKE
ncbi:hypothetical protein KA005_36555 [bacterium]|nr:hypothetical protein [bacterium]